MTEFRTYYCLYNQWYFVLTLHDELNLGAERLRRHLIGRFTPVDGVVVGRFNGKDQLILGSVVTSDVREIQLIAVAVPIDLRQGISTSWQTDQTSRVTRLQHLPSRVTTDLWDTRWVYQTSKTNTTTTCPSFVLYVSLIINHEINQLIKFPNEKPRLTSVISRNKFTSICKCVWQQNCVLSNPC